MKNTNIRIATTLMVAFFFSSFNLEAKNNYFNNSNRNEEKVKVHRTASFMPTVSIDEAPSFPAYRTAGLMEKYTPTQLNEIMGIWPSRETEPKAKTMAEPSESVQVATPDYSPEAFVNILGITF